MLKEQVECWKSDKENLFDNGDVMKIMIFVNQMHRKKMEQLLEGSGLYRAQHRMLMTLSDHEFRSQAEVAKLLEISTATVAVSLKKLERDGYIQKTVKEEDSRANFVQLTERGRKIVEESREIFQYMDEQVVKGFSEEDITELRKYLKRIYINLSEMDGTSETKKKGK